MATITQVPMKKICPDPNQPRKIFNVKELQSLAESIRKEGQIQPLILESNWDGDKFLILDGERRYRANLSIESEKVPAIIYTGPLSVEKRAEIRFNVQDAHANWCDLDKARAIYEYRKSTGFTIEQIAEKLNMQVPKVHGYLSITDFSDKAQKLIAEADIQFSYLTYLARIVKSYMALSEKFSREEIEEKMIAKIANGKFKTVPEIQSFSKTLQNPDETSLKIEFLSNPEMSLYEYFESLKVDAKEFTTKLQKALMNVNFMLKQAKDKNFRVYDEQFAVFVEITNKMTEFESIQALEQAQDDGFEGF